MVEDTEKIFLFLDLSLSAGSEAALVARRWYMALNISTLTMYTDTATRLHLQKINPVVGLEAAVSIMQQWVVFLTLIPGPETEHQTVYDITLLINVADEMSACLQAQAFHQPDILAALVRLIHTGLTRAVRRSS